MPEYLVSFNAEWVPEHTEQEIQGKARALRPLIAEMKDKGVLIFTGGLDSEQALFSIEPSGEITDGPFIESKEHLGGFAVLDVDNEEELRHWASRIATVCGWPQEVYRFRIPMKLPEDA